MTLQFPNTNRVYEAKRRCVTFWGHDAAFEIAFRVDSAALDRLANRTQQDEADSLRAFDANRDQIERAASRLYGRRGDRYIQITPSDF